MRHFLSISLEVFCLLFNHSLNDFQLFSLCKFNAWFLQVKWVEQQQVLERDKRSIIPDFIGIEHPKAVIVQDPMFKDQWYLVSCVTFKRAIPAHLQISLIDYLLLHLGNHH